MKKRILFVDDEQSLLDGLRRALRGQRKEWDMSFALSGAEALRLAAEQPFDAVVTDMRMPGMDGIQLLAELVKDHDYLVRVVLSGHSDEEMTLRSVELTHQYLAKPCDIEILKIVLIRAFALRDKVHNAQIRDMITGMNTLPSLPAIYTEITQALQSPDVTTREVGHIIAQDPAMTAKILQMVNSAFFGIGRKISNPAEAASLLGMDILKSLVLSTGIFSQFDSEKFNNDDFNFEELWRHSMEVASLAKRIALAEGCDNTCIENCVVAGLLHDIGKLVLADNYPEEYRQMLIKAGEIGFNKAEQVLFEVSHGAIGAYMLGLWGLSEQVVEAVAFHQTPCESTYPMFSPLTAVHVASGILDCNTNSANTTPDVCLDSGYLEKLGLSDRLETWLKLAAESDEDESS